MTNGWKVTKEIIFLLFFLLLAVLYYQNNEFARQLCSSNDRDMLNHRHSYRHSVSLEIGKYFIHWSTSFMETCQCNFIIIIPCCSAYTSIYGVILHATSLTRSVLIIKSGLFCKFFFCGSRICKIWEQHREIGKVKQTSCKS